MEARDVCTPNPTNHRYNFGIRNIGFVPKVIHAEVAFVRFSREAEEPFAII
jgi:hypothetical protein